jgi:hypothetical protein
MAVLLRYFSLMCISSHRECIVLAYFETPPTANVLFSPILKRLDDNPSLQILF